MTGFADHDPYNPDRLPSSIKGSNAAGVAQDAACHQRPENTLHIYCSDVECRLSAL
ncbi:MAG: hypothetical protein KDA96_22115 [Planctomycetaceae bacterium]|nr:hypothetical protein [Planctomycetaceae bacterium]